MPPAKPKPSEIAAEAKRLYIPYVEQKMPQFSPRSSFHVEVNKLPATCDGKAPSRRPRIAVIDGDPVDVALDWYEYESKSASKSGSSLYDEAQFRIPVVNMANEKRAGGDWESGLLAPEENLCRRSNLVRCLMTPWTSSTPTPHYPIPSKGGMYSPSVGKFYISRVGDFGDRTTDICTVIFRSGPDRGYSIWSEFKCLPVISVAPIRRPKLDESGMDYSFSQEKELMKEKMRTVLRIAATWQHKDICMGAFGSGPGFRNPVHQLASMWRDILFTEPEFQGVFTNVVFAIESMSSSSESAELTDHEIFKQEFDPSNVFRTAYR